jgi:EAL domain-containing protein (putative c-di-GMP-specific phosphodiesterase class I)
LDVSDLFAALKVALPSLLVLDLALRGSDAIDVLRKLDEICYPGKILLISGRDEPTLKEARRIGIARGLTMLRPLAKPFFPADFFERLDEDVAPRGMALPESATADPAGMDAASALNNGWMTLWYQPKFDIAGTEIVGAEALIRLIHPDLGVIPPRDFLPPAGDPVMHRLSEFVLVSALVDWQEFVNRGLPLKLSINMPVSVLAKAAFVRLARERMPRGPDFPGLIVEVTEDEAIADLVLISEVAVQLKLCGVNLSIDDVGVAHSGLSRFLDLPFVEVKIDRRFVHGCASDQAKLTLCKMIVDLAHHFDATACAEGVEEENDLEALAEIKCDHAQGFLLGRPMDFEAFVGKHVRRDDLNKKGGLMPLGPR